jgi:hypothetical protein
MVRANKLRVERVNHTDDDRELESLRQGVQRGRPFGQPGWQKRIAKRLGGILANASG